MAGDDRPADKPMDDAPPNATPPRFRRVIPPLLMAAAVALFGHYRVEVGLMVLLLAAVTFICNLTQAAVALALGVTIEEIGLFVGSPVVKVRLPGSAWLTVNQYPCGGYVKFRSHAADDPGPAPSGSFQSLSLPGSLCVIWCAPVILLILALAIFGVHDTAQLCGTLPQTFVHGVFSPLSIAAPVVRKFLASLSTTPGTTRALGLLAVYSVLIAFVPMYGSALGMTLGEVWRRLAPGTLKKPYVILTYLATLIALPCGLIWLVAICAAIFRS